MAEPEHEYRVRYRIGDQPDLHGDATANPKEAGDFFRGVRGVIESDPRGGEAEIQRRQVPPWEGVGEKAVIPPKGE